MPSAQQLQAAAEAMIETDARGRAVVPVLKRLCPAIYHQLRTDGRHPGLLSLWGRSVNVDENVGQVIVHPAILRAIGDVAGVSMRGRFVHAGLQHTYGYLFSLIETPYGRKRDRWITTHLEHAFGLEETLLGAEPSQGTLLANLTWFLGHIVFRGQPRRLTRLERVVQGVARQLIDYRYGRLAIHRIVEEAMDRRAKITILTDLIRFPKLPADRAAENHLLIYSLRDTERSPTRLVTAFTVTQQYADTLKGSASRGSVAIRLRFNAYLPGLHGRSVRGRRFGMKV